MFWQPRHKTCRINTCINPTDNEAVVNKFSKCYLRSLCSALSLSMIQIRSQANIGQHFCSAQHLCTTNETTKSNKFTNLVIFVLASSPVVAKTLKSFYSKLLQSSAQVQHSSRNQICQILLMIKLDQTIYVNYCKLYMGFRGVMPIVLIRLFLVSSRLVFTWRSQPSTAFTLR